MIGGKSATGGMGYAAYFVVVDVLTGNICMMYKRTVEDGSPGTETSNTINCMFVRLGTDYEIRDPYFSPRFWRQ